MKMIKSTQMLLCFWDFLTSTHTVEHTISFNSDLALTNDYFKQFT